MVFQKQLSIVLFGTCLFYIIRLLECRMLEGYTFPVFSTKECPGNQAEWNNRSSSINCNEKNGYMCLPNENFTDLIEFCYIYPRIMVQKDLCLVLTKRFSRVNSYNCRKFTHGCPDLNYFSDETYIHPSCSEIENGCFSAEPNCKRQPVQGEDNPNIGTTVATILGVSIPSFFLCIMLCYFIRKRNARQQTDIENPEEEPLVENETEIYQESPIEKAKFDQWKLDDSYFISTKAYEKVQKSIKSRNLVIVAGHSGSGKSAIIQHIALKYREQDWTVKMVKKVQDIVDVCSSNRYKKNKTIFVFNDPLGKESLDEIMNNSWQTYEEELKLHLRTAKLLMSCRNHIMSDPRLPSYLVNQSDIIDIDHEMHKLSLEEKRQILTKYTSSMKLSDKDCDEIIQIKERFPLLCRLYSSNGAYKSTGIRYFTEPETVMKEIISEFRKKDKGKYCALALLVFFNDDICVSELKENKDNKFKNTLKLCGLPENTTPSAIMDNLNSLENFLVKNVRGTYHFYHDFVMEVTTHVFGTDYTADTIKYADISVHRRKIRIERSEDLNNPFTIILGPSFKEEFVERVFTELFGDRLMDVVLNPCLKNQSVVEALTKKIQKDSENHLQKLLKKKELEFNMRDFHAKKNITSVET